MRKKALYIIGVTSTFLLGIPAGFSDDEGENLQQILQESSASSPSQPRTVSEGVRQMGAGARQIERGTQQAAGAVWDHTKKTAVQSAKHARGAGQIAAGVVTHGATTGGQYVAEKASAAKTATGNFFTKARQKAGGALSTIKSKTTSAAGTATGTMKKAAIATKEQAAKMQQKVSKGFQGAKGKVAGAYQDYQKKKLQQTVDKGKRAEEKLKKMKK